MLISVVGALMLLPLLMPLVTLITDTLLSHFEINPFLLGISTFAFDADKGLVALTFIFACLAGIFTSIQNKHLTISVVKDNLPEKAQLITDSIIRVISIALLLSLFFATFPNIISIISPDESIWGIPVRILFLAISIMYAGLFIIELLNTKKILLCLLGIVLGLIFSLGSILTIFYQVFSWDGGVFSYLFELIMSFFQASFVVWALLYIVLAFFGMPLYIVLSGIAYIAFLQGGGYVDVLPLESYTILADSSITAIPLFTIAGCLFAEGSAAKRLTQCINSATGFMRGGPIIASVLVATLFTTFTGASGVTILALGGVLSLILTGTGNDKDESEALITASGAIGILLPPSLAVILYAVTNIFSGANVLDIFKGALLPGLLLAVGTIILGIVRDKNKIRTPFSLSTFVTSFKEAFLELLLPIAVFILYFTGIFSLVQTAAFAAVYAFIIEVFLRRDFSIKEAFKKILESVPIIGGVLIIVSAAKGLASFFIDANVPYLLSEFVLAHISSKYVFLLLLNLLLLIVGCIMDLYSAILVVSPLIIPIAESFGIAPVHLAVIFLTNLALGFLTPPVGMNLFIASYTFEKPVLKIARDILPYLLMQAIILLLVTYVPWFSMVFVE